MNEYPPEVQAVLDAALDLYATPSEYSGPQRQTLAKAVLAYRKATTPPEPFVAFVGFGGPEHWRVEGHPSHLSPERSVWRCTVVPIERVR